MPAVKGERRGRVRGGVYDRSGQWNRFPASAGAFAQATGMAPTALYTFDEASGPLLDRVGSAHLPAAGAPVYRHGGPGGYRGVLHRVSTSDAHSADVNAVGTSSFIVGTVGYLPASAAANHRYVGRLNAAAADGYAIYTQTDPSTVTFLVRDVGTNSLVFGLQQDPTVPQLYLMQVDRAASTLRGRISGGGRVMSTGNASIAGFGSLDGPSQLFAFGSHVLGSGVHNFYAFLVMGVQTEGLNRLAQVARGLGWE
jgi:hypothetical protein